MVVRRVPGENPVAAVMACLRLGEHTPRENIGSFFSQEPALAKRRQSLQSQSEGSKRECFPRRHQDLLLHGARETDRNSAMSGVRSSHLKRRPLLQACAAVRLPAPAGLDGAVGDDRANNDVSAVEEGRVDVRCGSLSCVRTAEEPPPKWLSVLGTGLRRCRG